MSEIAETVLGIVIAVITVCIILPIYVIVYPLNKLYEKVME